MHIRPLTAADLTSLKQLTDQTIGLNYFSMRELKDALKKSTVDGLISSFVLIDDHDKIQGFRLAYPPGSWNQGKGTKLRPDLWKVPIEKVGYFQSLFLSESARSQGWGPKLSQAATAVFLKLKAEAILTHAWKESPQNSSLRYLQNFGFQRVVEHPHYWIDVDYVCVLDGKPCQCTAVEMIKYL